MPSTTVSVWKNSLPFMMRKPRPSLAATSSAEITQVHDRPRITLKPLKICGRLAGRMTERMTCGPLAPRLLAARISSGSILRVASITYSSAGANVPMNTMLYFCVSVMPNHSSERGIQLIEGKGRRNDRMGSKAARARCDVPRKIPSGMASAVAAAKPTMTRRADATMWSSSEPCSHMLPMRANTSEGGGRNSASTHCRRHTASQNNNSTITDTLLISSRSGRRWRFCAFIVQIQAKNRRAASPAGRTIVSAYRYAASTHSRTGGALSIWS